VQKSRKVPMPLECCLDLRKPISFFNPFFPIGWLGRR
jgi:hypothetical protein